MQLSSTLGLPRAVITHQKIRGARLDHLCLHSGKVKGLPGFVLKWADSEVGLFEAGLGWRISRWFVEDAVLA